MFSCSTFSKERGKVRSLQDKITSVHVQGDLKLLCSLIFCLILPQLNKFPYPMGTLYSNCCLFPLDLDLLSKKRSFSWLE